MNNLDIESLLEKYKNYIRKVIINNSNGMLKNEDIEDVESEVYEKIWQNREKLLHVKSVKNYIVAITKNVTKDKIKEVAKQKYPNTKLVILVYEENLEDWSSKTNRWKELEKEGFIVLNSYDLTNLNLSVKKYRLTFDKNHPNELAWNILTPKIAEKLKL